jgi:holin-like protein
VQYLKQLMVIIAFSLVGQALEKLVPLPVPAAVYGLVLLLLALLSGLVKVEKVKVAADFLISVMPVLFIAPAVKVLEYWGIVAPNAVAILVIIIFTTGAVFGISGLVTKWLMKGRGKKNA